MLILGAQQRGLGLVNSAKWRQICLWTGAHPGNAGSSVLNPYAGGGSWRDQSQTKSSPGRPNFGPRCPVGDAPPEYGPRKTLYNRYVRWAEKGVWAALFETLAQAGGPPAQILIDSSAVKAHRSAAGGTGGRQIRRSAGRAAGALRKSMR